MRVRRLFVMTLAATVAIMAVGSEVFAQSDISSDFATDFNPNGVWTYGFAAVLTSGQVPDLVLYDQSGTDRGDGLPFWRHSVVQVLGTPTNFNNPIA